MARGLNVLLRFMGVKCKFGSLCEEGREDSLVVVSSFVEAVWEVNDQLGGSTLVSMEGVM